MSESSGTSPIISGRVMLHNALVEYRLSVVRALHAIVDRLRQMRHSDWQRSPSHWVLNCVEIIEKIGTA
jgi:hypothetical protein